MVGLPRHASHYVQPDLDLDVDTRIPLSASFVIEFITVTIL